MGTITVRSTPDFEDALEVLTGEGQSRSEAIRQAVLDAARAQRGARLRAEAEALNSDPREVAAARELEAELDEISAW